MSKTNPQWNPSSLYDSWGAVEQVLRNYFFQNLFTVDICKVSEVNEDNSVDVVSVFNMVSTGGTSLPPPAPLYNIPVFCLKGAGTEISIPVTKDDVGIVLALKTDPANYFKTKEQSVPASSRLFSLSNGVFLPLDFGYTPNGITIKNQNATINLKAQEISLSVSSGDAEEAPSLSRLVLTPSFLSGEIQGGVSITAQTATVNAGEILLGQEASQGIARIGDTVVVGGVSGQITTGSAVVKSA